ESGSPSSTNSRAESNRAVVHSPDHGCATVRPDRVRRPRRAARALPWRSRAESTARLLSQAIPTPDARGQLLVQGLARVEIGSLQRRVGPKGQAAPPYETDEPRVALVGLFVKTLGQ